MRNNLRLWGFDCMLILIAFLLTGTFGTLEAKVIINPNGGFEAAAITVGDDTSGVEGWSFQKAAGEYANFVIVDDTVNEGNRALKITINSLGTNAWDIQAVNETFPVIPGVTYSVSVWARTETGDASAHFTAGAPDYSEFGRLHGASLSDSWQEYTFNFTVPAGKVEGRIPIHFNIDGNEGKIVYLDALTVTGPNFVSAWGFISVGGWDFVPGEFDGDAGMTGESPPTAWLGLYGEFDSLTATTENAVVATGKIEFSGGDLTNWSALRYGFYNNKNAGELQNAGTDTAIWSGNANAVNGYIFTPITAPGGRVSWRAGGNHTQGVIIDGGWNTTNNWGGEPPVPLGEVIPAPAGASLKAGTYDFAISVQPQGDGTNELRWFLQEVDKKYWFGGTVTDTVPAPDTYNAIVFGIIDNIDTGMNNFKLLGVEVDLGPPITVPEPPFSSFYVDQWGFISNGGWSFVPGVQVGDAGMTGESPPTAWLGLYGQFAVPVTATEEEEKALIVTGQMEFSGGDLTNWSALRYGLYNNQNAGNLQYAGTDSATWSGNGNSVNGYIFTPITAPGGRVSWRAGGNHTQGVIIDGGWNTTNNWGGVPPVPLGEVLPAPPGASLKAGTYDFAMSVQPQGDGTNELRWFLQEVDKKYWFGGTVTDTVPAPDTYNAIVFGIIDNIDTGMNNFKLLAVKVDLGSPITVPEKPWSPYYLDAWGFLANRTGGWEFVPGIQTGNAGARGTTPNTDWAVIRGGFYEPVKPPLDRVLEITGKIIFEDGGFEGFSALRYGLFYAENPGTVVEDDGDSTTTHWTGSEDNHSGYLFLPRSGTNDIPVWAAIGGTGTWGAVLNTVWWSTNGPDNYILGSDLQTPDNAVAGAGTYDFTMLVQRLEDGGNAVKFSLVKDDASYSFAGETIDKHIVIPTDEFNGVAFGLNSWNGSTTTAMMLRDVRIDLSTDLIVGIKNTTGEGLLPAKYTLEQNYPNPFNPTTTIEFALPQSGDVSLVIYDVSGRIVEELASGYYSAGSYKINFNAANLASGIYFYRLKAEDFVSVKKLILMK